MNNLLVLDGLVDDYYGLDIELGIFAKNMKEEVIGVINSFLSFLTIYDEKLTHNMLVLMLEPRLKSLILIFSFINHELGVTIATHYERKYLFPLF
jgi:hypothetical protein